MGRADYAWAGGWGRDWGRISLPSDNLPLCETKGGEQSLAVDGWSFAPTTQLLTMLVSLLVVRFEIEPNHKDQQKADSNAHRASDRHHISNAKTLLPLPLEH